MYAGKKFNTRKENANGEDYDGTWTKDDLYGEINIDTSKTGKSVEKYQYSYNGVVWNDISSEIVLTSIDYTTAFPLSEDKPKSANKSTICSFIAVN